MQPGVGWWTAICNVTCSVAWQRVGAASEPFEATCAQRDAAYWQYVMSSVCAVCVQCVLCASLIYHVLLTVGQR